MEDQQNHERHPEGYNQVACTDEHNGEQEEGPEYDVLQKGLLARCDRQYHKATTEVQQNIGEAENIGVHIDFVYGH